MDWLKIILFVCIIIQEVQILLLRRDYNELSEMFVLSLAGKIKDIRVVFDDPDLDEDDNDNTGAQGPVLIFFKNYYIIYM